MGVYSWSATKNIGAILTRIGYLCFIFETFCMRHLKKVTEGSIYKIYPTSYSGLGVFLPYFLEILGVKMRNEKKKNVGQNVGYIRVSTIQQKDVRQLTDIKLDKVFRDKTGAGSANRPKLKDMMAFVREGDTLHVHSLDRLARNTYDLLQIVDTLLNKGVAIKFHKENLLFTSKSDSVSKLMMTIMEAFAEFERAILKERQAEGGATAKAKGVYKNSGRSKSLKPKQIKELKKRIEKGEPKTLTPKQIKELKKRIEKGEPKTKIAKEFGVTREAVYRYLDNA